MKPFRKKMLIITFSWASRDPRVYRHIEALRQRYSLTVLAFGKPRQPNIPFFRCMPEDKKISATTVSDQIRSCYLHLQHFDLIIANDIETLPLAFELKKHRTKILLDAGEYSPRQFENDPVWIKNVQPKVLEICQEHLQRVDGMFTPCQTISKEYKKNFGQDSTVLTNATHYQELPCQQVSDSIKLIYHGGVNTARSPHLFAELVDHLDERFSLDIIAIGYPATVDSLKSRFSGHPKINFVEPVSMTEIVSFTNHYDIGVAFFPPTTFNLRYCLPNKLFEYIQARLMVAIGPSPEMAKVVNQYRCGIATKSFDIKELARELNKLTSAEIFNYKKNSATAAKKLNFEHNQEIITRTVANLIDAH